MLIYFTSSIKWGRRVREEIFSKFWFFFFIHWLWPSIIQDDDDDWETDPDYVNNMSEEQQRWGGARDTGTLDMDKFREEIKQEDSQAALKRQQEDGYKSSTG